MVRNSLRALADRALKESRVTFEDVQALRRDILEDGPTCREEAEVLISLDRAVATKHPVWADYLVQELVNFVVWTSRPTGSVDAETTAWLTGSLGGADGPTETAMRVAFEIVREAEHVGEDLLVFALRTAHRRGSQADWDVAVSAA
jgi:hypothetical protein